MQVQSSTPILNNITVFFRNLSIGKKLTAGFGMVLMIIVLLVAFIEFKLSEQDTLQSRVLELRVPTNIAGHDLVNGINFSLAALRGYMILGKDSFKLQREKAWKDIDLQLAFMTDMSKHWTVAKNIETLEELKAVMGEFKIAQQQVEDISHTADEQPAMKILITEAAPRAEKVVGAITGLIDEEKNQPATPARKALLATFADSRGSFALGLAAIRGYLISGDEKWVKKFNNYWKINSERLETIFENQQLLTAKQQEHFEIYLKKRTEFSSWPKKMFEIRGSNKWNMANYLLGSEAAPRAIKALRILAIMVENQNKLVANDVTHLQQQSSNLKIVSFIATVFALVIGLAIAWVITKLIVSSLNSAIEASQLIASGDLSNDIVINSSDETGQLLQSMSDMQEKLTSVIETDIQLIVDLAKQGDLSERISLDDKDGFLPRFI